MLSDDIYNNTIFIIIKSLILILILIIENTSLLGAYGKLSREKFSEDIMLTNSAFLLFDW